MNDQTTQTAVDATQAPATPGATADSARNDGEELDKLLSEYDQSNKTSSTPEPARPESTGTADTDLKALADEVRGLRTERQKETFRKDMDAMVKNVRGNLDPEFFDDVLVESWIDAQARQDSRLLQVFANRHDNPKQFAKIVDTLNRNFARKWSKLPDKGATEDRAAVAAAVRGASTTAPPEKPPEYASKSNTEFRNEVREKYGYTPKV